MSSTDAALSWLLSLDAVCTSSPIPTSASPDFTDWIHISPTTNSPTTESTFLSSSQTSSPPFKDLSFSSRVNSSQQEDSEFNYFYGLPDLFSTSNRGTEIDNTANLDAYARTEDVAQPSYPPGIFNRHNRMVSLESTSATLINTPSSRSLSFFSPSGTIVTQDAQGWECSANSVASPATKCIQDLQRASFANYYPDFLSPSRLAISSVSDFSPVIRSDKLQDLGATKEHGASIVEPRRKKKKKRDKKYHQSTAFVDRLHFAPLACERPLTPALPLLETAPPRTGASLNSLDVASSIPFALLSPVRLLPAVPPHNFQETPLTDIRDDFHGHAEAAGAGSRFPSKSPPPTLSFSNAVSPLSPLTDLTSSPDPSPSPLPPLKITLKIKRKSDDYSSTPPRPTKIPRKRAIIESPYSPPTTVIECSQDGNFSKDDGKAFAVRTLPENIEVSTSFPLFYRRFPVSSYFKPAQLNSPCTLFGVSDPGGLYNHPRSPLDLYTPRFVKGKGAEKVGLCPICIEPLNRGGEDKRVWLAMKFSAFKCYHMQYAHGISASTGRPFSPPLSFRTVDRQNPGKKEKDKIQQGKCHKCEKWVAVEGIKAVDSKVKELHWWKHAAACHHGSNVSGEGDYYEEDVILSTVLSFQTGAA